MLSARPRRLGWGGCRLRAVWVIACQDPACSRNRNCSAVAHAHVVTRARASGHPRLSGERHIPTVDEHDSWTVVVVRKVERHAVEGFEFFPKS